MKHGNFNTQISPLYMWIILICLGVIGVVGNIITCIIIISNKSMHTVTNCYLLNLAISDLMFLFWSFPPLNYYNKYHSEFICVTRAIIAEAAVYASVLTISAFSVERYVGICHPFLAQTLSKFSRAKLVIKAIWAIAFLSALPLIFQMELVHHIQDPSLTICTLTSSFVPYYLVISSSMFFFVPIVLIVTMYMLIGLRLRKSTGMKRSDGNENGDANVDKSSGPSSRVSRMLVAVVVAFFVCWAPFHLLRLTLAYTNGLIDKEFSEMHYIFSSITSVFYYLSAVINPILYNIMSNKFREAFKATLLRSYKALNDLWSNYSNKSHRRTIEIVKLDGDIKT